MIELENVSNDPFYNKFSNRFKDELSGSEFNAKIQCFITEDIMNPLSGVVSLEGGTPMASNAGLIKKDNALCKEYGLDDEEIFAIIAHEIGHCIDEQNEAPGCFKRERYADLFACSLGLGENLLSALGKLVKSQVFSDQEVECMQKRICLLSRKENRKTFKSID